MSVFFAQVYTSTLLPFKDLFHEDLDEYYRNNIYLNQSNIYFLSKIKKVRFVIEKTVMFTDNKIGFCLQYDNNREFYVEKIIFDVSKIAFLLREYFSSQLEFTFNELFQFEIDYNKSTSEFLEIKIIFVENEDKSESFQINVFHVWGNDDSIDLENYPEIIYIGQSKNILKRFRSHGTVLKAVSQLSDSEELLHYFITFKVGYGGHRKDIKEDAKAMDIVMNMNKEGNNYWDMIDVLERVLIYFYQPKLNELHMKTPIEQDLKIQKFLRGDNIKGINVNVGVYGKRHMFWSPNQKLREEFFSYNFDFPEKGFTEGLDGDLMGF